MYCLRLSGYCHPTVLLFSQSDLSSYRLYMGRYQLNGANQFETSREVKKLVLAQGYSTPQEGRDVALVELSSPLTWTSHIQPVCLPNADFEFYRGTMCYVTGWGDTQEGGECKPQGQLKRYHKVHFTWRAWRSWTAAQLDI